MSRVRTEHPSPRVGEVRPVPSSLTAGQLVALLAIPVVVGLLLLLLG